ncbi:MULTISPECIES: 2-amino-4-hydroxy-6-hydroxymethyldihydropteridine diphosphokinase [unclassified Halomonas]|uniref:2-amino-4-hydroxy-6- hydroxymethyldihydropteridine diphosphokinase n=1 Tax=unclassified Halomonas TaxID=2609666 RepID=UPI0006DB48D7|nr:MULTISPECIES: 2-amino-4-hydroxy-6-hydroxymethyldihydropteridine diphosphokinase [unclassified Halomonas]KPQ19949.1 MAG: 2-amino-4-hydroxy-6-hydroxymethyldihydropteridine diphosphokinase [Halomonas sp. HL-93]SBR45244.1 2-amino-4-hydroxy-6-hydroxymethyldihydropteridinediphosphokinase [Halomonas sp. HL-93]SNY97646.1 2-amino-4-hydroxy-6-hydroxymethyldihydropteridinediphosphokinase [Halomonas sp. hl-4]
MSLPRLYAPLDTTLHECVISLGSNIDPERHATEALDILCQECELLGRSREIITTPVGYQQQPNFLNAALLVRTRLSMSDFRAYLKSVEDRLGRVRGPIKSGPRTMDLDIVAWDGELVDEGYLHHDYVRVPVDELLLAAKRKKNLC